MFSSKIHDFTHPEELTRCLVPGMIFLSLSQTYDFLNTS